MARKTYRQTPRRMARPRAAVPPRSLQGLMSALKTYWGAQGCVLLEPYDMEMGAGTFHPATMLRALGPDPWRAAYVQPCRRPADGRYGAHPNRFGHYYQFQTILKPSPDNIQALYLDSLAQLGISPQAHDIRFVEDDWESPTLGAWGLGWEVWCDGMEISQFTYFQQIGGLECQPVSGELTYGLERLAMFLQGTQDGFALAYNDPDSACAMTYGDVFRTAEAQFSAYHFVHADVDMLMRHFQDFCAQCHKLIDAALVLPAYDQCMKASHCFNVLDARGALSVQERENYIGQVRALAQQCAQLYVQQQGQ